MRELAKKRKEEGPDGPPGVAEPGASPSAGAPPVGPPPGGEPISAPTTPLDDGPPGAGPPRENRPPIADPGRREYPPDRIAVSERGIPYHEERIHGDPYEYDRAPPGNEYVTCTCSFATMSSCHARVFRCFSTIPHGCVISALAPG